jgi:hypothetical protein
MLHQSLRNGLPKASQRRSKVIVMVWKRGRNDFFLFYRPCNFFAETRLKEDLSAIAVHTQVFINRLEAER